MKFLWFLCCLTLVGCASAPVPSSIVGRYSTAVPRGIGGETAYTLSLSASGAFEASYYMTLNGVLLRDSSFHAGGYSPHEHLQGTWEIEGQKLFLRSGEKRYEVSLRRVVHAWEIVWDDFVYAKRPNQSPEPTAMSVTPPAAQESRQP